MAGTLHLLAATVACALGAFGGSYLRAAFAGSTATAAIVAAAMRRSWRVVGRPQRPMAHGVTGSMRLGFTLLEFMRTPAVMFQGDDPVGYSRTEINGTSALDVDEHRSHRLAVGLQRRADPTMNRTRLRPSA
jgi:hypothetical protein